MDDEAGCLRGCLAGIGRLLVGVFVLVWLLVMTWQNTWAMLPYWVVAGILVWVSARERWSRLKRRTARKQEEPV